ncbi:MAG: response regulator [Deltaproteobacteria bacterium]|nr:response regulator [Deltaproteobacteria bacterium]MBW1932436.1 response regulator [Deltaproteobacteria bacterium]MBW1937779.1 response regulator [Deltaproteobacteria bacterium]MBW1963914.1 response regulator [Deltaproteobacteria bacterium]
MDKDKILIVEDNVDTVDLLRKRLRADGYDTAEAYDGEEGLERFAEYEPDLVVLDIMMPKLDGFEVCKRLKEDESTRQIPVLMLTAKGDVDSTCKGLDVGGDDYLAKPFDYKELVARIRSLLSMRAEREKLLEEEKSEALEKMMDQVAHEIRNPLVAIGGFARRISDSLSEDDPNKKCLELIIQNVETLEHMIKKLIELKTTVISYREPVDINEIIAEAIEEYRLALKENHVDVKTELMKNPPDIFVDREQIKVAFANLIENAVEAMRNETRILKIGSRVSEGYVEIKVSDTGVGIPKDKLKNVLDPFFTSKIHAGLGLTYALKIIQAHRGTVSVGSEPGKGSTFTIRLPVKRPGSH